MAGQPRNVVCHLCGKPTNLSTFLSSHLRTCEKMWREDESTTVKALITLDKRNPHHLPSGAKGRDCPARPKLPTADGTGEFLLPDENIDDEGLFYYNELSAYIWKTQAQYQCKFCHRGFVHAQYLKHAGASERGQFGGAAAGGCRPKQAKIHFGRKDHVRK